MGDRWLHRVVGFIFYVGLLGYLVIVSILKAQGIHEFPISVGIADIPWLVMGFGMSMFGAEIPDYDQYRRGKYRIFGKRMRYLVTHRSGLTHSPIIPVFLFVLVGVLTTAAGIVVPSILLTAFLLGHLSHLLVDLKPGEKEKKEDEVGSIGKEKKKTSLDKPKQDPYCLHFVSNRGPYKEGTMVCPGVFTLFEFVLGVWALKVIPGLPFGWS